MGDVVLVSGIANSAADLDQRSRDVNLGMVSKAIADNVGAAVFVVNVLALKASRGVEINRLDEIGGRFNVKSFRQDTSVTPLGIFTFGTDNPDIRLGQVCQADDFGDAPNRIKEDMVVGFATVFDPGTAERLSLIHI